MTTISIQRHAQDMNTQTQTSRIRKIDVGIPPSSTTASDSGWEIIQVHYHNFENLTATRGEAVVSSEFTCFGHTWIASVFPGGMTSCSRDGMVSILLHNLSNKSIKVQYGFSINSESHVSFVSKTIPKEGRVFAAHGTTDVANQIFAACGIFNFCERTKIIENLVDGTLVIEVRMRLVGNLANPSPFIPENPHAKTILKLFNDEESADIVFEVGSDESGRNTRKRAKTTTTFHAHRLILQQCSSTVLNELCKSGGEEAGSRVSITDVKPEVFKHLLYYVYGGKIADEDMEENAKEIIDAADKYGIVGLKLEAEAYYFVEQVHYHGFLNLPTQMDVPVLSPDFTCFGHKWRIEIYPDGNASAEDGMVSIGLRNRYNKSIKVQFGLSVIKDKGRKANIDWLYKNEGYEFAASGTGDASATFDGRGNANFCTRTQLIENLVDGTLIIEVRMRHRLMLCLRCGVRKEIQQPQLSMHTETYYERVVPLHCLVNCSNWGVLLLLCKSLTSSLRYSSSCCIMFMEGRLLMKC